MNKEIKNLGLILLILTFICDKGLQIQFSFSIFLKSLFWTWLHISFIKSYILNLISHILNSKSYKYYVLNFINIEYQISYLRY